MHFRVLRRNSIWPPKMVPVDSTDTLRVKNFVNIALSHTVSKINAFFFPCYTKIQDGRQKWRENAFWEKLPIDSANNLWVKNFVKITLF